MKKGYSQTGVQRPSSGPQICGRCLKVDVVQRKHNVMKMESQNGVRFRQVVITQKIRFNSQTRFNDRCYYEFMAITSKISSILSLGPKGLINYVNLHAYNDVTVYCRSLKIHYNRG